MRATRRSSRSLLLLLVCIATVCSRVSIAEAGDAPSLGPHFSGTIVKRVDGKTYHAQVFGKEDRLRLEYRYAVRTELGFYAIEIIRLDLGERWYLLPQQKVLLVVPVTDDTVPIRAKLVGETNRIPVGDASVARRTARLFYVEVNRTGIAERYYEWVDAEMNVVLKLVSLDRDWSFEYERLKLSPQPRVYFEAPPGYHRRESETIRSHGK
jgi:hypothetical protein